MRGDTIRFFNKIVDHKTDGHESKDKKGCLTTKGHWLLVDWKDGTQQWIPLKDMKESFPLETAEFAHQNELHNLPAFAWWVPFTIKKRNKIISAVHHRMVKRNFKYGEFFINIY